MKEKLIPYNLRLPKALKAKIEKQAKAEKRSMNQHVVYILEVALAEQTLPAKPQKV